VRLLLRQRRPGPIGDLGPLFLGQGGVNMEHERVRVRAQLGLGRADLAHQLARTHYPRKLPRVLAPEQVARLIEAAPGPGLKYKAALSIAYGAGLRGCEVVMLRVGDIDCKRMLIRVEMGKGRKDRHAMLSPQLLELLRAWWSQCRSRGWLFPGQDPLRPITVRQLNRVCRHFSHRVFCARIAAIIIKAPKARQRLSASESARG
jgi:integrase/recombinase XerD